MKATSLGCICNDPTVQPHIPQFLLPKFRGKKEPPQYLQEYYIHMGYLVIIKHGTIGWNDEETMREVLLELRSVVHSIEAQMWIMLVLGNCRLHTKRERWRPT